MTTPNHFKLPDSDPSASVWSLVDPAERALIEANLMGPPVAIGNIARLLGIEVLASALSSEISGQIRLRPNDGVYEIKVNIADPAVRQRFTVAHEVGHFLLHRNDIDGDGITDSILFRSKLSTKKEVEANKVAARLLLPWNLVTEWTKSVHGTSVNPALIEEIASAWKVSALTVGYRFGF